MNSRDYIRFGDGVRRDDQTGEVPPTHTFLLHFRCGGYAFCDGNAGPLDCSDIDKGPFGAIGIGKAF